MPYGDEYRAQRKVVHAGLNPNAVQKYQPLLGDRASLMVLKILNDAERLYEHVKLYVPRTNGNGDYSARTDGYCSTASKIVLSVTYGAFGAEREAKVSLI